MCYRTYSVSRLSPNQDGCSSIFSETPVTLMFQLYGRLWPPPWPLQHSSSSCPIYLHSGWQRLQSWLHGVCWPLELRQPRRAWVVRESLIFVFLSLIWTCPLVPVALSLTQNCSICKSYYSGSQKGVHYLQVTCSALTKKTVGIM